MDQKPTEIKQPTPEQLQKEWITKRAAAQVILGYVKTNRALVIGSIAVNFTYLALSYVHPWAVFFSALSFSSAFGYFLYRAQRSINQLTKTYSL